MPKDEQMPTMTLGEKTLWLSTSHDEGDNAGHGELADLLANPQDIPASWRGVLVFAAAGTTDESEDPCVLSLAWTGKEWEERNFYLGGSDWLPTDRFVHVSKTP